MAVRAEVFGFKSSLRTIVGLKDSRTDFAEYLSLCFAVVVIQKYVRRIAAVGLFALWNGFPAAKLDGFECPAMLGLISLKQNFVV